MTLVFYHDPKKRAYTARLDKTLQVHIAHYDKPSRYKAEILHDGQDVPLISLPHFTDHDPLTNLKIDVERLLSSAEYTASTSLLDDTRRDMMRDVLSALRTVNSIELVC